MDKHELKDRVFKTFIEIFFSVLIPDIGIIVNQIIQGPTALATAASATWNTLKPPAQQPTAETPEPPQDPPDA